MVLEPLSIAIENILKSEGYDILHKDPWLSANKGDMHILIAVLSKDDDPVEVVTSLSAARDEKEQHLVVVTDSTLDDETVHIARTKGVAIWTKEDIEEEIHC